MFKQIGADKVSTREYQAKKQWKLDDSAPEFTFQVGANVPPGSKNNAGSDLRSVYELIRHTYYRENGNPYQRFGVLDISQIDLSTFPKEDRSIIYVLKISSKLYGKRIAPGSLKISTTQEDSSLTAVDDGKGNLIVEGQNTVIGNVFYSNGTLVLTKRPQNIFQLPQFTVWPNYTFEDLVFGEQIASTGFPDYEFDAFDLLFRDFDIEFQSTVSNFENQISAEVETDEFGATTNPTAKNLEGDVLKKLNGQRPYITTAGFYNDDFELIAKGKLARPIQVSENSPLTIIARFDT